MRTGVQSDHFFIQRAYTLEERREILRRMYHAMQADPHFNIHFLRADMPELNNETTFYEGKGVLLMDAYTGYDLHDDHFIDNPHNSLARNPAFASNIYVDPGKILYIAKGGIRREAMLRGLGFGIGVLPPKGTVSEIRSIPLEGCFFHFSAVTNTQSPAQPEVMRLLQLAKQYLDEAYPEY